MKIGIVFVITLRLALYTCIGSGSASTEVAMCYCRKFTGICFNSSPEHTHARGNPQIPTRTLTLLFYFLSEKLNPLLDKDITINRQPHLQMLLNARHGILNCETLVFMSCWCPASTITQLSVEATEYKVCFCWGDIQMVAICNHTTSCYQILHNDL